MKDLWPWLALAGLGAFHGLNPAMGWLFAVALGLNRKSRGAVLMALPPIALGHAVAIAVVAGTVVLVGVIVPERLVAVGAGCLLVGWAAYHQFRGHRHRVRVGMTAGQVGLLLWSFLMATAHGAGLMIVPALIPLCLSASPMREITLSHTAVVSLAAVGVHTGAMLATTGLIAVVVFQWVGLGILRSAWINIDLIWTVALALTGALLLLLS
jgi:hypothetical protein